MLGDNDFLDPWGTASRWSTTATSQFTKTDRILRGMGLNGLEKRGRALDELRSKGLAA